MQTFLKGLIYARWALQAHLSFLFWICKFNTAQTKCYSDIMKITWREHFLVYSSMFNWSKSRLCWNVYTFNLLGPERTCLVQSVWLL